MNLHAYYLLVCGGRPPRRMLTDDTRGSIRLWIAVQRVAARVSLSPSGRQSNDAAIVLAGDALTDCGKELWCSVAVESADSSLGHSIGTQLSNSIGVAWAW